MSGRKKCRPQRSRRTRNPRARHEDYPFEHWPAFKLVPGTGGRLLELDLAGLTSEQRAEWDRLEAERERSRELHERFAKRAAYRAAVRDGLLPPPWMKQPQSKDGPKVHCAKELMQAVYPNREWRQMMIKAVRDGCAGEAQRREWRLPSPDSFSIAMVRRRRK